MAETQTSLRLGWLYSAVWLPALLISMRPVGRVHYLHHSLSASYAFEHDQHDEGKPI